MRKSRILASQTPFKIHPKRHPNRGSKKHCFLHRFLLDLRCLLQRPNLKIRAPSQCFVDFLHILVFRCWHAFLVRKIYQKPFQNHVRALQKSMSKMHCFLASIFGGSGLDFEESGPSNLEPSWPYVGTFFALGRVLGACWAHFAQFAAFRSALGSILDGFGLPKPMFWRPKRLIFPWFLSIMH